LSSITPVLLVLSCRTSRFNWPLLYICTVLC